MNDKLKIHFFYVVLILIALIVIILTVDWGSINELVKYITFALTLTSLFVSLLAIIYAFLSNSSFSQNIGLLNTASSKISETSDNVSEATENLQKEIMNLPDLIRGVGKDVKVTQDIIKEQFSEMGKKQPIEVDLEASEGKELSDEQAKNFITSTSIGGSIFLYVCLKAYQKGIALDFKKITEIALPLESMYYYGFMVASASSRAISYTIKEDILNIKGINKYIAENIEAEVKRKIKYEENKPDKDFAEKLKATIEGVNEYFKVSG